MGLLRNLWWTIKTKFTIYDQSCRECKQPLLYGQEQTCSDVCRERYESTSAW